MSDLFRPRDSFDDDVHPESARGQALALMDAHAHAVALIESQVAAMPWYRRWPARAFIAAVWAWVRIGVRIGAFR